MATATTAKKPRAKKAPAKKKTTDVLVAWAIDRSGSMGGHEDDTIDGFNAYIEEQKAIEGNMWLSLLLFDDQFNALLTAQDIREVPQLDRSTYYVGGGTALYDAVGLTIEGVEGWLANNPSFKGAVEVIIWTDGDENRSQRWPKFGGGLGMMMDAVKAKREQGWSFTFLGSGGAAWTEGQNFVASFGRQNTTQVTNSSSGRRMAYAAASHSTKNLRMTGQVMASNASVNYVSNDTATMANYGVSDTAEALAGTSNFVDDEDES